MYHKVLTVDLSPHISRVLPSLGRFGSLRAQVGLGFAVVGWFRRVRLPPPLRWSLSVFRRPPLFFSLGFSGFARFGPVCWCWCFLLLLSFLHSLSRVPVK